MTPIVARWQDWAGEGVQHLVLRADANGIVADAVIVATEEGARLAARLRIECDPAWRTRGARGRRAAHDSRGAPCGRGPGLWPAPPAPRPHPPAASAAALPLTPFTNTLPIRRLGLAVGASADLAVVYIRLPERDIAR